MINGPFDPVDSNVFFHSLALAQRLQNEEQEFLSRQPQPQLQRPYPQQMRQPVHRFPVQQRHPSRGEIVGRETSDNRNVSHILLLFLIILRIVIFRIAR